MPSIRPSGASAKPLQVEGLTLTLPVFGGVSVTRDSLAEPQSQFPPG